MKAEKEGGRGYRQSVRGEGRERNRKKKREKGRV